MRILRNSSRWIVLALFFGFYILYSIFYIPTAQAQCQTNDRNQGLISATQGFGSGTIFGNQDQVCVTGNNDISYREFKVPSYQDLENQFFTQTRSKATKYRDLLPNSPGWGFAGDGLWLQTHSTSVVGSPGGTGAQIIFIKGDLDITSDINYGENDPASGLVFVVERNINIAPTVQKINAALISYGIICTAMNFSTGNCYNGSIDTPQLVIDGNLISLNKTNLPAGESAIKFGRTLSLNTQPAEIVRKQAKFLYILRNGLFTKDILIRGEDKLYDIQSATSTNPAPPPPASTPAPPSPPCITGTPSATGPYLGISDVQSITGCIIAI